MIGIRGLEGMRLEGDGLGLWLRGWLCDIDEGGIALTLGGGMGFDSCSVAA